MHTPGTDLSLKQETTTWAGAVKFVLSRLLSFKVYKKISCISMFLIVPASIFVMWFVFIFTSLHFIFPQPFSAMTLVYHCKAISNGATFLARHSSNDILWLSFCQYNTYFFVIQNSVDIIVGWITNIIGYTHLHQCIECFKDDKYSTVMQSAV